MLRREPIRALSKEADGAPRSAREGTKKRPSILPEPLKFNRIPMRQFEPALAFVHRAGERAFFVAEQFGLEQVGGEC